MSLTQRSESWSLPSNGGTRDSLAISARRRQLKTQLASVAIAEYCDSKAGLAEEIMKDLESLRPHGIVRPAEHTSLNARWSFCFTGVPTIGMRLITLLSRMSSAFSAVSRLVLDFDNVFLEVSDLSQVQAVVRAKLFGRPLELVVRTNLQKNATDCQGTYLIESFDSLELQGFTIPTPASWKKARDLEISYLDDDLMIARTAHGEPHLLLRHSTCSPDDDTCSVDDLDYLTSYFQEAHKRYGDTLSRSLVDRDYRHHDHHTSSDGDNDDDGVDNGRDKNGSPLDFLQGLLP